MHGSELKELESKAAAGDVEAAYLAGCARHDDDDVSLRALDRSLRWLRLAADAGHAPAARRLGYIHIVDLRNPDDGVAWYTRAAEAGDAPAAYSLGHICWDTKYGGRFHDPAAAERWLEQALAGGHPGAARPLGLLLLRQGRPAQDAFRGAQLLSTASALDFLDTWGVYDKARRVGGLVSVGHRVDVVNDAEPFPLEPVTEPFLADLADDEVLDRAAAGDAEARFDQGLRWAVSAWPSLPESESRAFAAAVTCFEAAAEGGVVEAAAWLATLALKEPGVPRLALVLRALSFANARGVPGLAAAWQWVRRSLRLQVWVVS